MVAALECAESLTAVGLGCEVSTFSAGQHGTGTSNISNSGTFHGVENGYKS